MLGLDFVLNGAIFARMYQSASAFVLSPAEAARRIPFGYLSERYEARAIAAGRWSARPVIAIVSSIQHSRTSANTVTARIAAYA